MGWWGGVGSDALPSSSPSLIWLQLGFGLARAVTTGTFFGTFLSLLYQATICKMFREMKVVSTYAVNALLLC